MKHFDQLVEITKKLNSTLDLDQILQLVVNAIAENFHFADMVKFFLKRDDDNFYYGHTCNRDKLDISSLVIDPTKDKFVSQIIEEKRSIFIADAVNDPRLEPIKVKMFNVQSILGVPVLVENEVFGLIFVHNIKKPMEFSLKDITRIEGFVSMAAVAIHNVRIFSDSRRLLEQQKILLEVTRALTKSLSVEDVLDTSLHFIKIATGVNRACMHIYDEQTRYFRMVKILKVVEKSDEEWNRIYQEATVGIDKNKLFYEIYSSHKPIAIYDVSRDARSNLEIFRDHGIKSVLIVPMVSKGNLLGTISLYTVDEYRYFTRFQEELTQSIADMTATALANSIYAEHLDALVKERTFKLQEANLKLENLVRDLKKMDEFKNDFITTLSHELRTPITSVQGVIDLLLKEIPGPLNDQQKGLALIADKATEKLLDHVNELLDYFKLEKGMITLSPEMVNYRRLVEETVKIVKQLFKQKNQTVKLQMEDFQHCVFVEEQRIRQVLFNLLSNAQKFTQEGGMITVKVAYNNGEIITSVSDTGVGIPLSKQQYIFTKFFRVDQNTEGTGLGLSICKQLVQQHHGRIWFESEQGKGSTFSFSLPVFHS